MITKKILTACILIVGVAFQAGSQTFPTAKYDPNVPTLQKVVGHDHGEAISSPTDIHTFMRALAEQQPKRMKINKYGETWQGRDLIYGVISSQENIARLDSIQADLQKLGEGESLDDDVIESLPAVIWLSYGVHGNEISPPDSALFVAYHLLAAEDDELVNNLLQNTVIVIDPLQNPDGRARFVHHFESSVGLAPLSDIYSVEHQEPWPRGRFNHYLFDLNRDWFAMTQPETQGKIAAVLKYNPVIYVDSHEMSGESTYYFPPAAKPHNPNITEKQHQRQAQLGKNMGSWFDRYGVPYFTREVYDAFYPGYGDMWPTLNGAIAMTFEQASARALVRKRRDGKLLTYKEGVRNNVLSSLATLETVANNKNSFLRSYLDYRQSAIEEGKKADNRYILIDLAERRYEAERLARTLAKQGIEVHRLNEGARQCRTTFDEGAIVIDKAQPQGRLIKTLLSKNTPLKESFIEEQEKRRANGLNHELYDVTAWSMILMSGLNSKECDRVKLDDATIIESSDPLMNQQFARAEFGYAISWDHAGQARTVVDALKAGLIGKTTDKAFTYQGKTLPMGSVIFSVADNPDNLYEQLSEIAARYGSSVTPMQSSWVEEGPNFGSRSFAQLKLPKIALVWGEGTNPLSAGNTRFVLERQLGLPVSPIRMATLSRAKLENYDVIIVPDTYGSDLSSKNTANALKQFVSDGGTLVAFESSIAQLAKDASQLFSTKLENASSNKENKSTKADSDTAEGVNFNSIEDYEKHIHNHNAKPEDIPGVLVKTLADQNHFLASGYQSAIALVTGREIYQPLNEADGTNVFKFAAAEELLESGYLWEESRLQLAFKPFVIAQYHSGGIAIGFTQSPTTRAYLEGLNLLLANAVILSPTRVAQ